MVGFSSASLFPARKWEAVSWTSSYMEDNPGSRYRQRLRRQASAFKIYSCKQSFADVEDLLTKSVFAILLQARYKAMNNLTFLTNAIHVGTGS